jgi:hypothetical protein
LQYAVTAKQPAISGSVGDTTSRSFERLNTLSAEVAMKKTNRIGSMLRTKIVDISPVGYELSDAGLRLVAGGMPAIGNVTRPASMTPPGQRDTIVDPQ